MSFHFFRQRLGSFQLHDATLTTTNTNTNMTAQKTVTIAGVKYTAKNLLILNETHGCDFLGGDRCITLSAGQEIGIRIYKHEQTIGILDYGLATRSENKRIFASVHKFLKY